MFTCFSNLVWGPQEETDPADGFETSAVEHSTHEEAGEWLVISTGADVPGEKSSSDPSSQESECDRESMCSDGSWIVTPAPTFRVTGDRVQTDAAHPLENLLIEHPTMSVYGQVHEEGEENGNKEGEEETEEGNEQELQRARNHAQEMVRLRNRQRYAVAVQLQLPTQNERKYDTELPATKAAKSPLRVTKKGVRRHNQIKHKTLRGRQQTLHVKKCTFVAGRRRC